MSAERTPDVTEALRPELELTALRPYLDADGRAWLDQRFGSPMSLTDHVEAATGVGLGDASLWESHRGHRREQGAAGGLRVSGDLVPPTAGSGEDTRTSTRMLVVGNPISLPGRVSSGIGPIMAECR